jgi:pectin methylesterase-like acyl-CoA thioesterase
MDRRAGLLALGLAAALAPAANAAIKAGTYSGTTSERGTVSLTIAGHKLKNLKTAIGYNGSCGQGGGPSYTVNVPSVKLKTSGAFTATIVLHSPNVQGFPNRKAKLTGKAKGTRVTGKIAGIGFGSTTCAQPYEETFTAQHT